MKIIKKFEKQIILAFILGFLVAAFLTLFGDFKKTTEAIFSFKFLFVIPILLLTLTNYIFRFFRWQYFLSVVGILPKLNWKDSFLVFFSGLSMTITPGRAGELMKAYFLKKMLKNHFTDTAPVVVIERLTDGLAALVLMAGGLLIYQYGIPIFVLAALGTVFLVFILQQKNLCLNILKKMERFKLISPFISALERFYHTSFLLVKPKHLLVGMILGMIAWGAEAIGLYLVLIGLGVNYPHITLLFTAFFIFCFAGMIGFATLLPGGLGVAEGTTTGLLMLFLKLPRSTAVAATLLIRIMTLWFGVFLGLIALFTLLNKKKILHDNN